MTEQEERAERAKRLIEAAAREGKAEDVAASSGFSKAEIYRVRQLKGRAHAAVIELFISGKLSASSAREVSKRPRAEQPDLARQIESGVDRNDPNFVARVLNSPKRNARVATEQMGNVIEQLKNTVDVLEMISDQVGQSGGIARFDWLEQLREVRGKLQASISKINKKTTKGAENGE